MRLPFFYGWMIVAVTFVTMAIGVNARTAFSLFFGTALGPHGVNIMDFCKNFNAKTAGQEGLIIPAVVTIYADRSYTFITKTPPASILLKRAANIAKGSAEPNKTKVGTVTAEAGRRDRQDQAARSERRIARSGRQDGCGHGAVDGPGCDPVGIGD